MRDFHMMSMALPAMWWLSGMMAGALALGYACSLPAITVPAARVRRQLKVRWAAASDARLPRVTLLIPALDEPTVVAYRIERALSLDYPAHKLQVVAALEGCDDRVESAVRAFAHRGVRVIESIDTGLRELSGEVVMVCDDDQPIDRETLLAFLDSRAQRS